MSDFEEKKLPSRSAITDARENISPEQDGDLILNLIADLKEHNEELTQEQKRIKERLNNLSLRKNMHRSYNLYTSDNNK